jgi:glycosyltransferase involved in cell wall biosynthesis
VPNDVKLMIHSNAPEVGTGYAVQITMLIRKLREQGYDIAVSAFYGGEGKMTEWEGHPVYPKGKQPYGGDVLGLHARHFGADLILTLMDFWALPEEIPGLKGQRLAAWLPVDCTPLSVLDEERIEQHRPQVVAMSRFGQEMVQETFPKARVDYAPHMVDLEVFRPPDDRDELRRVMGVDDKFVIFMNAANKDQARKGWFEQMAAFARLAQKHDDVMLVAHTDAVGGLDLNLMAARMGIAAKVKFSSQYLMAAGLIGQDQLRGSYGMADLYSCCSLAEGFGIPIAEALACGVPVVVTDGSSMTEVAGPTQWKVDGQVQWASGHAAYWKRPNIDLIHKVYEKAYAKGAQYTAHQQAARKAAERFEVNRVVNDYWLPILPRLAGR